MKKIFVTIIALIGVFSTAVSAQAANGNDFSRNTGLILRAGVGPDNFDLGAGVQLNPHFAVTAEAFSFSGLTSINAVADVRYYVLDKTITPFVDVKAGYGMLGKTIEYRGYYGMVTSATAGISLRRFDLGAGVTYDEFHKAGFIANLSWTLNLRKK